MAAAIIVEALQFPIFIRPDGNIDGLAWTGEERHHIESRIGVIHIIERRFGGVAELDFLFERTVWFYLYQESTIVPQLLFRSPRSR